MRVNSHFQEHKEMLPLIEDTTILANDSDEAKNGTRMKQKSHDVQKKAIPKVYQNQCEAAAGMRSAMRSSISMIDRKQVVTIRSFIVQGTQR